MCPASSSQAPDTIIPPRRRVTIRFQDDALRHRSESNAHALLISATSPDSATSNASLLARKALKYRRHLHRVRGVDVTAPTFDASKFLGVEWCKTPCLEASGEGDP
ncbi:hypothetical protein PINS_up020793 [Pythium insidiosum]|nr:hypothetical protein PINS_up020793 [Pythium insidiosum]